MPVLDGNFEAFVTNLGKYNEGELVGEWVKFPISAEEMQKVFERIGIGSKDEMCIRDRSSGSSDFAACIINRWSRSKSSL